MSRIVYYRKFVHVRTKSNRNLLRTKNKPNFYVIRRSVMSSPKNQNCNTCGICNLSGNKGYFRVPKESEAGAEPTPKRQWQNVIPISVSSTTRVCFRHFAQNEFYFTPTKGNLKLKPGKLVCFCQVKTKCKKSVHILGKLL